ncbi:MAG: hypothetical protein JHC87_00580 [Thermoleophilaceae bacterium]|nr:hypothetical protein [Thermoleophilaceae bacterium]
MTDYQQLLPREGLIADCRNDAPARGLVDAKSLREAAADLVREGYLMHYGQARYYTLADPDLALLAGDRLYAAGLAALSEQGDIEAVGILARLIAASAEAHAASQLDAVSDLWQQSLAMLAPDPTTATQ